MGNQTVVLCWRTGGDFTFQDVKLLVSHLHANHEGKLRVLVLTNTVNQPIQMVDCTLLPAENKSWPGWWTKMNMFSPQMEQYRPFLYLDLDTAVVNSLEGILPPTGHEEKFICLGGFFRPDTTNGLQSGLMWFPANNKQITQIWNTWIKNPEGLLRTFQNRGGDQGFLRSVLGHSEIFWQTFTNKITSFKIGVDGNRLLKEIPEHISIVCFHGQPRIPGAIRMFDWVAKYVKGIEIQKVKPRVTIIIPYKKNPKRIWLQDAINSVPANCQLIVSEGPGMWAENFNKVLDQAQGEFIKYLHDDDMLSENCIEDSIKTLEKTGADFIHGNAKELHITTGKEILYKPNIKGGAGLNELMRSNFIHSATTMYRKSVFEKVGSFDETLPDSEEYEFNLRCLNAGLKLAYCDSILAIYRRHEASQTSILGGKQLQETSKVIVKKFMV